jgi:hypothetical protein
MLGYRQRWARVMTLDYAAGNGCLAQHERILKDEIGCCKSMASRIKGSRQVVACKTDRLSAP